MTNVLEDIIMVNQINDSAGLKAMDLDSRLKTRNHKNNEPVAESTVASDSVNFSDISKQLDSIKASLKEVPEVDAKKVAHFKAEIAAGNYQINSNAIASKFLHNNFETA